MSAFALSGLAYGQRNVRLHAVRSFQVSPSTISSTWDVIPQIQEEPPFNPRIAAENDGLPAFGNPGPANRLRAGGLLGTTRGTGHPLFPGPSDGRWIPQDDQMAVGPNHVVCIINSTLAFYTKTGTKTFEQFFDTPDGFFSGVEQTGFVFDPKAFYDPISQRFFVLADDGASGSGNNILIAVSATNNPNGTWYKYRFNSVFGGSWLDYPGFGFNKDGIVVTGNLFDGSGSGVEMLVIKKTPLLSGGTTTATVFNDPSEFTMQPARTVESTVSTIYGAAAVWGNGNQLSVFAITNLTGTPSVQKTTVAVPSYSFPPNANSMGNTLLSDGDRLFVSQFRKGQLMTSHTIDANGNCGARWYDINVNNWPTSGAPSLKQSGTISQSGVDFFYPVINMNRFEDISVFFARSSGTVLSDLCYSARKATDPLNQLGVPVKLAGATSGGYNGGRWGDYFANEVDPNDDATFFGFGSIIDGGGIGSQVVTWTVTPPVNSYTPVPADSVDTYLGNYIIGDTTSIASADTIAYQIASVPIAQFGQAAGADTSFTAPDGTAHLALDFVTTGGISGGTTMVWLHNWNTGNWDLIGSTPTPASGTTQKIMTVRDAYVPSYIGPGNEVDVRVRGHIPIRPFNNQMPLPFTYNVDLFQLLVRGN